jgi:hypothetical protein
VTWMRHWGRVWFFVLLIMCTESGLPQSYGDLDTGFRIQIRQSTVAKGHEVTLTTTSTYPCEGYVLRSFLTREQDTLSIHVTGMLRPSPCIQSSSEATGTLLIGQVKPDTSFLRIQYRGETDLHRIINSKKGLRSRPIQSSFTRITGS